MCLTQRGCGIYSHRHTVNDAVESALPQLETLDGYGHVGRASLILSRENVHGCFLEIWDNAVPHQSPRERTMPFDVQLLSRL